MKTQLLVVISIFFSGFKECTGPRFAAAGGHQKLCPELSSDEAQVARVRSAGACDTVCEDHKIRVVRHAQGGLCIQECSERYRDISTGLCLDNFFNFYKTKREHRKYVNSIVISAYSYLFHFSGFS